MPRQLFGGAGDIVRAGLVSRSLPSEPQNAAARRMPSQLDLAFSEAAVRKAG